MKSVPDRTWPVAVALGICSFAALLLGVRPAPAQTQQEQNLFNTVKTRMLGHAAQMPHTIADGVTSCSQDCWGMSFPCPRKTPPSDPQLTGVTFIDWPRAALPPRRSRAEGGDSNSRTPLGDRRTGPGPCLG